MGTIFSRPAQEPTDAKRRLVWEALRQYRPPNSHLKTAGVCFGAGFVIGAGVVLEYINVSKYFQFIGKFLVDKFAMMAAHSSQLISAIGRIFIAISPGTWLAIGIAGGVITIYLVCRGAYHLYQSFKAPNVVITDELLDLGMDLDNPPQDLTPRDILKILMHRQQVTSDATELEDLNTRADAQRERIIEALWQANLGAAQQPEPLTPPFATDDVRGEFGGGEAAAAPPPAHQDFECPICFESFDDDKHRMHAVIGCGHIVCSACSEAVRRSGRCHNCRVQLRPEPFQPIYGFR